MANLGQYHSMALLNKTYELNASYNLNDDDYNSLFEKMNKAHCVNFALYHFADNKMFIFRCTNTEREFVLRYE